MNLFAPFVEDAFFSMYSGLFINGVLFAMVQGPQQSTHFRNAPDRLEKAIYHRL